MTPSWCRRSEQPTTSYSVVLSTRQFDRVLDALEHKLPRSHEMPQVEHIIVETIDPFGPFGAKEVGEGPIVCTLPAIANAVANALGVPVNEMPITPWQILRILGRRGPAGD